MIVVTAATGKLGHHVLEQLLTTVPASAVAVAVRNPQKAAALASRGVTVRPADYAKPETLEGALAGTEKLLLISGSEVGQRAPQHRAVIEAAQRAGVKHLIYTSILNADRTTMKLAEEHVATEAAIRESGLPYTFLRNGWYTENYTEHVGQALAQGAVYGATAGGRIGVASRPDFAAAAVAVLTGQGHEGKAYELAGQPGFTLEEYAAELSRHAGKPISYVDLPAAAFQDALGKAGVPAQFAAILADCDLGIARGELAHDGGDLQRLIGRASTPWQETVAAALASI